jgi:WhiB family transcriptional regulator, redox-sensing transcriptional regulator
MITRQAITFYPVPLRDGKRVPTTESKNGDALDTWDEIVSQLRNVPDLPGARCVGSHEIFDATTNNDSDNRAYALKAALELCSQCPALAGCCEWFDSLAPHERPRGVVAGRINGKEQPTMTADNTIPAPSARDHQRALRALVNFAQGDLDIMPALAAEIGRDVDWFVLALLSESIDTLDRRFGRAGAIAYLTGRLAAASDAVALE